MQQPSGSEETTYATADDPALYDRYGPAIFAYVRLYTSSREDAEDLTLEVFLAALEHKNLAKLGAASNSRGCGVWLITDSLIDFVARPDTRWEGWMICWREC